MQEGINVCQVQVQVSAKKLSCVKGSVIITHQMKGVDGGLAQTPKSDGDEFIIVVIFGVGSGGEVLKYWDSCNVIETHLV